VPIELSVVTPQGPFFSGPVESVVLPGVEGEFGVLEAHERFLSALAHGCMEIVTAEGSSLSAVSDGLAEVGPDHVVVMVDSVIPREEIDVEAARSAQESARRELDALRDEDDPRRADLLDALARAEARLAVARRR
jgi:F-type H+-transporting ATPase subunit epsilon